MTLLADHGALQVWLLNYGSFALFFLLLLGILALPIPEETLMVLAGILLSQEKLSLPTTFIAALLGSMGGISLSYCLGRLAGDWLQNREGGFFSVSKNKLAKVHRWFERFGTWTLFIGYFVPGVRHFTGICAGMSALAYKDFARFAYSGALVWVSVFLSIGYFFGPYWLALMEKISISVDDLITLLVALVLFLLFLAFMHNGKRLN